MSFFPRLPPLFYFGLLPVVCLLWLWADSTNYWTEWVRIPVTNERHIVAVAESRLSFIHERLEDQAAGSWTRGMVWWTWDKTGPWGYFRREAAESYSADAMPVFPSYYRGSSVADYPAPEVKIHDEVLLLPFWLLLLCYLPPWWGISWWQARRRKKRREAAVPEGMPVPPPPPLIGSTLRRFPLVFYVGLLPALALPWLWAESMTTLVEWYRTPSWGQDYRLSAAEGVLHFQHQWIMGELPVDVETYAWHELWKEARGPFGKLERTQDWVTIGALFPAPPAGYSERREAYVTVATKRVSLPFWVVLPGYLLLWLPLCWWRARRMVIRRRKKAEAAGPMMKEVAMP